MVGNVIFQWDAIDWGGGADWGGNGGGPFGGRGLVRPCAQERYTITDTQVETCFPFVRMELEDMNLNE